MSRRKTRLPAEVLTRIEDWALKGFTAQQIATQLDKDESFGKYGVPFELKTIQRHVKSLTPRDTSGRWSLGDADPDDARTVLDVLSAVIVASEGRITTFTIDEADWVLRVAKAAPGLRPFTVWATARFYMLRKANGEPTSDLDAFLAFAPWQSSEAGLHYMAAIAKGLPGCPKVLAYMGYSN